MHQSAKPPLTIRLCQPRGFCAGVDRAIQIVVLALKKYGAPVYVRHEIVHNRYVVEGLQNLGAVFIEELSEIPADHRHCPVVFSAHGVPKSVPADAAQVNRVVDQMRRLPNHQINWGVVREVMRDLEDRFTRIRRSAQRAAALVHQDDQRRLLTRLIHHCDRKVDQCHSLGE